MSWEVPGVPSCIAVPSRSQPFCVAKASSDVGEARRLMTEHCAEEETVVLAETSGLKWGLGNLETARASRLSCMEPPKTEAVEGTAVSLPGCHVQAESFVVVNVGVLGQMQDQPRPEIKALKTGSWRQYG